MDATMHVGPEYYASRFWSKVEKHEANECWLWTGGARIATGYGRFYAFGEQILAHRFAWELAHGQVPDGLFVLHRCDNPPCVNVDHLWLGTKGDNNRDTAAKGRHWHHIQKMARSSSHT